MSKGKGKKGTPPEKRLFIISPIGTKGTETWSYFDKVKRHIIMPSASKKGYVVVRADDISSPGRIETQIVERLLNDDLVVADLTDRNPNVFYELAVRHSFGKPVILIGRKGEDVPFDVVTQRVIFYDITDPDSLDESKEELERQIDTVESDKFIMDSPLREYASATITEKEGSKETRFEEIISILRNITADLKDLQKTSRATRSRGVSSLQTELPESSFIYPVSKIVKAIDFDDYQEFTIKRAQELEKLIKKSEEEPKE